jgi:hypothetical protein
MAIGEPGTGSGRAFRLSPALCRAGHSTAAIGGGWYRVDRLDGINARHKRYRLSLVFNHARTPNMTRAFRVTLAVSAALLFSFGAGNAMAQAADQKPAVKKAAGKCVLAGGEANMITQDLAEFMAKAALKNSINGMGASPTGQITLKCNQNGALQYCKATQRACK